MKNTSSNTDITYFNALYNIVWIRFLILYKEASVNFSFLTGWRYPDVAWLRGYPVFGRGLSVQTPEHLFNDIKLAAMLACNQLQPSGICYFWVSPIQIIILFTNPDDIAQLFKVHNKKISRRVPLQPFGQLLGQDSIFLKEGHAAAEERSYLHGVLWDDKVIPVMQSVIETQLNTIAIDQPIDLNDFFTQLTLNIFSKCYFGQAELSQDGIKKLSDCISEAFATSIDFRHFSKLLQLANGKPASIESIKHKLMTLFKEELLIPNQEKICSIDNIIKSTFLKLSEDDVEASLLGEKYFPVIYSKLCTLLIAGHETTAITFQMAVKLLAQAPRVLQNLRKELSELTLPISFEQIDRLEYLRAIIRETLRLYPSSGFIARSAECDFTLIREPISEAAVYNARYEDKKRDTSRDIKIQHGDMILIAPYVTHRRADLWPAPNEFKPERHLSLEDNSRKQMSIGPLDHNKYSYFPFSIGDRSCLGWKFAERELMLALAMLYLKYDVKIEGDNNLEVVWRGTFRPKYPTFVKFTHFNFFQENPSSVPEHTDKQIVSDDINIHKNLVLEINRERKYKTQFFNTCTLFAVAGVVAVSSVMAWSLINK